MTHNIGIFLLGTAFGLVCILFAALITGGAGVRWLGLIVISCLVIGALLLSGCAMQDPRCNAGYHMQLADAKTGAFSCHRNSKH